MSSNLWQVDFEKPAIQSPAAILQEQSTFLSEKTDKQIVGEVVQDEEYDETGRFLWMMYLRAPALGNYRFRLLSIEHGADFYPLKFRADEDALLEVSDEVSESFGTSLKKAFGIPVSEKQSMSEGDGPEIVQPSVKPFLKAVWSLRSDRDYPPKTLEIESEEEFLGVLEKIFNTKRVAKVINAILAQIAA